MKQPLKPVSSSLKTAFEYVELPYLKVVSREELTAALGTTTPSAPAGPHGCCGGSTAGDEFLPSYSYPVHAWQLGEEMLVIGLGARGGRGLRAAIQA